MNTYKGQQALWFWRTDLSPPSDWPINFSQLAPWYKHTALDRPAGRPLAIVLETIDHVAGLFSKTMVKGSGAVQIKP